MKRRAELKVWFLQVERTLYLFPSVFSHETTSRDLKRHLIQMKSEDRKYL